MRNIGNRRLPASLLPALVALMLPVGVQGQDPEPQTAPAAPEPAPVSLEQELADRLAELEAALEAEAEAERALEVARSEAAGADEARLAALEAAEEALEQARADVASAKKLYDAAAERYRIERQSAELERQRADAGEDAGPAPGTAGQELGQRWSELELARQEAELARLQTAGLQQELDALVERQARSRQAIAEIDERLRGRLARARRSELAGRRRELEEEERSLAERIEKLRRELLEAKVAQRLQEDEVARLAASYADLKRDLLAFAALLAGALLLQWALRRSVVKRVKEPHRRYQLGKLISFSAGAVVVVGFVVIFAQGLNQLVAGLGIAVAGLAIAVREAVASFVAWFFIRGIDGYRIGDWIRLGGQEGEVVDIGYLVTVLEQIDPLDTRGETGGRPTGGLAYVANAEVFRGSAVHYTRPVPFIWCTLSFTVTYESDWRLAERLTRQALEAEKEIVSTARRARRDLEASAEDFALRVSSTEPLVRVQPAADGIELTVRFLVHPRRRQSLRDGLSRRILDAVAANEKVNFAYRTVRSVSLGPPPALPPEEI